MNTIEMCDEINNIIDLVHTCVDAIHHQKNTDYVPNVLFFTVIDKLEKIQKELKKL